MIEATAQMNEKKKQFLALTSSHFKLRKKSRTDVQWMNENQFYMYNVGVKQSTAILFCLWFFLHIKLYHICLFLLPQMIDNKSKVIMKFGRKKNLHFQNHFLQKLLDHTLNGFEPNLRLHCEYSTGFNDWNKTKKSMELRQGVKELKKILVAQENRLNNSLDLIA